MSEFWRGPSVIGQAAAGLTNDASWAANEAVAAQGAAGERRTAGMLCAALDGGEIPGVVVLNDLAIPAKNLTANVDHVVVTGRTVVLIDSKVWKPGRYITLRGKTYRTSGGWPRRFPHADKETMEIANSTFVALFRRVCPEPVQVVRPVLAVWPSGKGGGRMRLRRIDVPGADTIPGARLVNRIGSVLAGPAAVDVVNALLPLVTEPGAIIPQTPSIDVVAPVTDFDESGLPDSSDFDGGTS